jgi:3-methyladenine DNA glycosylase AlkD
MKSDVIISELKSLANPQNVKGMSRYGINTKNTLGISIFTLRPMAARFGKNHKLALELWASGIHEARLMATFIDEPAKVSEAQMEKWVLDFDSWDVCDQCCSNLFDKTSFAYKKAFEWTERDEEFVKRAGFVLMAALSVHDKKASDSKFEEFFPIIIRESIDERNFVKKAVNWALRQIGKRNLHLNSKAISIAEQILEEFPESKSAKWIARDAIRELTNDKLRKKLEKGIG